MLLMIDYYLYCNYLDEIKSIINDLKALFDKKNFHYQLSEFLLTIYLILEKKGTKNINLS